MLDMPDQHSTCRKTELTENCSRWHHYLGAHVEHVEHCLLAESRYSGCGPKHGLEFSFGQH